MCFAVGGSVEGTRTEVQDALRLENATHSDVVMD